MILSMSQEEYLAQAYVIDQQVVEIEPIETKGFILDIGGGGEGIIGRLNGEQVIAIDKRLEELEEADNNALKIVMDATDLQFLDETFTVATAFFTFMYIPNDVKLKVFTETYRVLKSGGKMLIWDVVVPGESGDKEYFVIPLRVVMPGETVETGYGVGLKEQNTETLKELAVAAGFKVSRVEMGEYTFYLEFEK